MLLVGVSSDKVELIISDAHVGLQAARKAVFSGVLPAKPRQRRQPVQDSGHHAAKVQRHPPSFHQSLGALNTIGRSRMLKRFNLQVMVFIPPAGTDVVFGHASLFIP